MTDWKAVPINPTDEMLSAPLDAFDISDGDDLRRAIWSAMLAAVPPAAVRQFTNELGNAIRITIEGPTSLSENTLTPMEADQLRGALNEAA